MDSYCKSLSTSTCCSRLTYKVLVTRDIQKDTTLITYLVFIHFNTFDHYGPNIWCFFYGNDKAFAFVLVFGSNIRKSFKAELEIEVSLIDEAVFKSGVIAERYMSYVP